MKLKNKGEIWRPIRGFEKLYEISSLGRVKSLARPMHLPIKEKYYISREKIMSPARIGADGYEFVYLRKGGKDHRYYVHRLVADNFLSDIKDGNVVNHINGVKYDNRVENLEWCGQSHNMRHAIRVLGLGKARKVVQYDKHGNYIKIWNNAYEAAEKLGINRGNINSCVFPFKKEDARYNLDKEYGVVEAQTWNLNNTIILELYTYLRKFQERFMHYGTPICFVEKVENGRIKHIDGGEKDWHKIIQQIIDGLKAYLTAQEKFQFASSDEDRAEQDRLYKQFEEA